MTAAGVCDEDVPELECLRGFPDDDVVGGAAVLDDVAIAEEVVEDDPAGAVDGVADVSVAGVFVGVTVR